MSYFYASILFLLIYFIPRANFYQDKCIGGRDNSTGIINNNCSDNQMCVEFPSGWFCVQVDESTFDNFINQAKRRSPKTFIPFCAKAQCQYGGVCRNDVCHCLRHFRGKYCEAVDYCSNHACQNGARCLPRIGGYNCECTKNHIGKFCQFLDPLDLNRSPTMVNPDFLYEALQYTSLEYTYVFFSESFGFNPKVSINFGDGTILDETDFQVLENASQILTKKFRISLSSRDSTLGIYRFTHSFKNPKVYSVEVIAWNGRWNVFNSTYQVRVVKASSCTLDVLLRNYSKDLKVIIFFRRTPILFSSTAWSNCSSSKIKLKRRWKIYKNKASPLEYPSIKTRRPSLNIPPFTLDFGNYTACVSVKMIQPLSTVRVVCTKFRIVPEKVVAHIQGGSKIFRRLGEEFYLDASLSFDPNFAPDDQRKLKLSWSCKPEGEFCDDNLFEGPILLVPSNALKEMNYTFQVTVDYESVSKRVTTAGVAKQTIQIVDSEDCFFYVNCVRNCIGGLANPDDTIVLSGVVASNCFRAKNRKMCWHVSKLDSSTNFTDVSLAGVEVSNVTMIIHQKELQSGTEYLLSFTVDYNQTNSCNFVIRTLDSFDQQRCAINPSHGIAMLTAFAVSCPEKTFEGHPVIFEFEQIVDWNIPEHKAMSHRLSITESIEDITLGPGLQRFDYVTCVRVSATTSNGLTSIRTYNVTVYPLVYYLRRPEEIFSYVNSMVRSKTSTLEVLLHNGNKFEAIGQIASINSLMQDMGRFKGTDEILDLLVSFLIDIQVINFRTAKLVVSALNSIAHFLPCPSSTWTPVVVNQIAILNKIVQALIKENFLTRPQVEMMYVDVASIAATILKLPNRDFMIFREDLEELVSVMDRRVAVRQSNPLGVDARWNSYDSSKAIDFLLSMMEVYTDRFLTIGERPSVVTSNGVRMLMQRAHPKSISSKTLSINRRAAVRLNFHSDKTKRKKDDSSCYDVRMLVMDSDPLWYSEKNPSGFVFPSVQVNVRKREENSPSEDIPMEVDLHAIETPKVLTQKGGKFPIKSSMNYSEADIQFYKILLKSGGKLVVEFLPLRKDHGLLVMVKRFWKPTMMDFWENGIVVPQDLGMGRKGWLIFSDDPVLDEPVLYYLGVFIDANTIRRLTGKSSEYIRGTRKGKEKWTRTIPYNFTAYSVYCFSYDRPEKSWTGKDCSVESVTSSHRVRCNCSRNNLLTVSFRNSEVETERKIYDNYEITTETNPIIIFTTVFFCIIFVGLLKWTMEQDRGDRLRRTVCFLVDNNPRFEYTYLVIVYTGRGYCAGTTSKIAIELVGNVYTSFPHVLTDWARPVLARGNQDWFVIKTLQSLGDVRCLRIWTDFSGEKPNWFCEKVVVHDIQEQKFWLFMIKKWFDPLVGDGSMSYISYQTSDHIIFSSLHYYEEILFRELDAGMHGWFSIFYKYPYNNFTRTQRAAIAVMHTAMIMLILVYSYDLPNSAEDQLYWTGDYVFEWDDLYKGVRATLIAFPIHLFLVCFFRAIKPGSKWIESRLDRSMSRYKVNAISESYDIMWIRSETKSFSSNIRVTSHRSKESFFTTSSELPDSLTYSTISPNESEITVDNFQSSRKGADISTSRIKDTMGPLKVSSPSLMLNGKPNSLENDSLATKDRSVVETYFFPPFYSYIAWIILVTITISSIYAVVLYGVLYGWMASLHYLTSLFIALMFSIFILETLKWILWTSYLFFRGRQVYVVEDRTDLVKALESEFSVPSYMKKSIIRKIDKLRENPMYQPLLKDVLEKLKNNWIISHVIGLLTSRFMLLMLVVLFHAVITSTIFYPNGYWHVSQLKRVMSYGYLSHDNILSQINTREQFLQYLKTVLIPNVQTVGGFGFRSNNKTDNITKLRPTIDNVNYLIGVMRLRQIRKDASACNIKDVPKWRAKCDQLYDTKNYSYAWRNASVYKRKYSDYENPWIFDLKRDKYLNRVLFNNRSFESVYAYEALLGRTRVESLTVIHYLEEENWFDELTTTVYVDFILFNPYIYTLTAVSIMAERTEQGLYYVFDHYFYDVLHPSQTKGQMYLMIYLIITYVYLTIYFYAKAHKYTHIKIQRIADAKFGLRQKAFLFFASLGMILYVIKTMNMKTYHDLIRIAQTRQLIDFGLLLVLDSCLSLTTTLMFIIIVLEIWCQAIVFCKLKLAFTVFSRVFRTIFVFYLLYVLNMTAFNWFYYMNFGRCAYNYRSFFSGVHSGFVMFRTSFEEYVAGNRYKYTIFTTFIIFFYLILMYFVWLSFVKAVIMSIYSTAKRNTTKRVRFWHSSVLTHYASKYFSSLDVGSSRKAIKAQLLLQNLKPKFKIMRYLFVDWYNQKRNLPQVSKNYRQEAMKVVVCEMAKEAGLLQDTIPEDEDVNPEDEYIYYARMLRAVRIVLLRNKLKRLLDQLDENVDFFTSRRFRTT